MPQNPYSSVGSMVGHTLGVDADGCIPSLAMKVRYASKAASYAVLAADSGTHFDNTGAAGVVTFTLPTAALGIGCEYWFTSAIETNPGTADIIVAATAGELVAYNDLTADSITIVVPGATVHVWSNGTKWLSGVAISKIDVAITVA